MRVRRLELTDYKCFEHLVLDNLGDRVVLVGPNGCGKSTVLEAIAVLKEFTSTYDPNPDLYHRHIPVVGPGRAWPAGMPLPVRSEQPYAKIQASFEFNDVEQSVASVPPIVELEVVIGRSGLINANHYNNAVSNLLRYFDPASGVGVIDWISPDRKFPIRRLTGLELGYLSIDQQRRERIELPKANLNEQAKFTSTKQFIISEQLEDFARFQATGKQQDSLELLRSLFNEFFAPKILLGYRKFGEEMQVAVHTLYGDHDIDQLSSGEKEFFSILVNLFRIRSLPSVILYDEPERHLNAGLEAKVIPALDQLQTQNQIIIATHGQELIGSVPMQDIIALKREAGLTQPERFEEESQKDRIRLLESLGAKVGLQLVSNRVVFLEGKDANADKRILDKLTGPQLPGVLFVAGGPSMDVMGTGARAQLLEQASKDTTFLSVFDRDYRTEDDVRKLQQSMNQRAYVWNCHESENLLLSPAVLLRILQNNGVETFSKEDGILSELKSIAQSLQSVFEVQWSTARLSSAVQGGTSTGKLKSENNFNALVQASQHHAHQLAQTYSNDNVARVRAEVKRDLQLCFGNGTWLKLLPGKEILNAFRTKHLTGLSDDYLKNQIVSEMIRNNETPDDVTKFCNWVKTF